ncbi:hypothetical protein [Kitasatospora sp. MMS16-BH015]|uniref:hypothetical protein n=1 Tax=Kitasatospora sp. MMS16-BH015 TaxID=2018025 RepID=UPI00131A598F|nr:hypothetical protein [Kitasatospora sp. MMS16-BH015]
MTTADPLPDIVQTVLDDLADAADPAAGHWLVAELDQRGSDAVWSATCLLLEHLAGRPAYGLPREQGADRLRSVARTAQPGTALALAVQLAYRVGGEQAAAETWTAAEPELRRAALLHLLLARCAADGFGGRLTAAGLVALVRATALRPAGPGG